MDEDIKQNSPQEPVPEPVSPPPPPQGVSASYTRPSNSSPNFFDKFFSIFSKKTVAGLVILVLVIGVGAATIATQNSTEIRQRADTLTPPPCNIPVSILDQMGLPVNTVRGYGDVNGDGQVTSVDSSLILQKEAGSITFTSDEQIEAADVDDGPDGKSVAADVNSIDSNLILQYTARLISTFPACPIGSVISGTVFQDDNGNGAQSPGETDYSGIATITLENGTTATKYGNGYYFTGVPSGRHTATLTVPSGYRATNRSYVSVTVPPNGTFKFGIKPTTTPTSTPTPTPTSALKSPPCGIPESLGVGRRGYGDVDKDGLITQRDSDLILKYVAGNRDLTQEEIEAADVNDDPNVLSSGRDVTRVDSALILQYIDGLITTFPVCATSPTTTPTSTPTPTIPIGVTATPTPAPTITPTIPPGNTIFALVIGLDGLGTTGDNNTPNDSSGSNKNPNRPSRNVRVEVFDGNDNSVANRSGSIIYNSVSGKFTGNIDMGTLASGNYNVKVKSDGYLRRFIPGIHQNVTLGQTYNLPLVNLVTGDINNDNVINILDYNILISCSVFSTDNHALCNSNAQYAVLSDLEDNGVVNQLDYNLFRRELSVQNGD